jgi:glycosyltransferase involved in cell wall biosynthesis
VRAAIPGGERANAKSLLAWAIRSTPKEYKLGDFFVDQFQRLHDEIEAEERRAREEREAREREAARLKIDPYYDEPRIAGKRALQRILTRPVYRWLRKLIWQYPFWKTAASAALPPEPVRAARATVVDPGLPRGVNLFGYFDTESGVGEIARSMASMLEAAGIPRALVNVGQRWLRRRDRRIQGFATSNPYAMNLFMINADQAPHVLGQVGEEARRGRVNVGYWFWELSTFPTVYTGSFDYFQEVWVASKFCLEAISACSPIPVVRVPPGFDFENPPGRHPRSSFGIRDRDFVFLYIFDSASSVARKNPAGLIHSFRAAFPEAGSERLFLKTINSTPQRDMALARLARSSRVDVLSDYMDRSELLDLLSAADCYVSLHRSEGLGLTLLESMALGKPVIATDYSGSADFLRAGVGFPVPYRLVPLLRTIGPYEKGRVWAEPDLREAARLMKFVRENPAEVAAVAAAARAEARTAWSVPGASRIMAREVDRLLGASPAEKTA